MSEELVYECSTCDVVLIGIWGTFMHGLRTGHWYSARLRCPDDRPAVAGER